MLDWRTILAEYGPGVWRTAYRMLGQHADALDCYQETFLAAWRFSQRQRVNDWAPFLASLAVRQAVSRLRQRARSRARVQGIDRVPEPATEADGPLRRAGEAELLQRLREALAELPDRQAEVFWLSWAEERTPGEIASCLGITANAARVLLHRARAHLRRALEPNLREGGERR